MPGPGPHTIYALTSGLALLHLSNGRFSPHHCFVYAVNAFIGPDLGSFAEWLSETLKTGEAIGSAAMDLIHHPFYYIFILGFPLSFFYRWVSKVLLHKGVLESVSGVPLAVRQCFLLVSAGSLSHFFLDHLFEENGQSSMYTWILSTGWWNTRAPNNPEAVIVVGFLCSCLIGGFIYIYRVKHNKSVTARSLQSICLVVGVASLYCLWCTSQIYWRNPRQPAVGEEADLGVLVFLAIYFVLPHSFCIMSINPGDHLGTVGELPR
ncbi:hypothetical protein H6P81_008685 [Aristolochia fimbriata]|uniref:Uncharacterized protein n=1 Tax=Aristolochia fimbriata TaxID=158543 RepID=A0AAV7EKV6_ARIFI|nr:hypothetical protein H6P81_008685 [Aristolochia fimbriata]